jgi:hypothetical protein
LRTLKMRKSPKLIDQISSSVAHPWAQTDYYAPDAKKEDQKI